MDRSIAQQGFRIPLVLGVGVPALILFLRPLGFQDFVFLCPELHAVLESVSATAALAIAVALLVRTRWQSAPSRDSLWLSCSFAAAGVLSALHAANFRSDNALLWGDLLSDLVGAAFALGVWVPESTPLTRKGALRTFTLAVLSSALLGLLFWIFPAAAPQVATGAFFNGTASWIGLLGAAGYGAAAVYWFRLYLRSHTAETLFFGTSLFLSAVTALLPLSFHAWGFVWWAWHGLQLLANAAAAAILLRSWLRLGEELQASEARFRALSQGMFEGTVLLQGGVIGEANAQFAAMTGRSREELVGLRLSNLLNVRYRVHSAEDRAFDELPPAHVTLVRSDGSSTLADVRSVPVQLPHGEAQVLVFRARGKKARLQPSVRGRADVRESLDVIRRSLAAPIPVGDLSSEVQRAFADLQAILEDSSDDACHGPTSTAALLEAAFLAARERESFGASSLVLNDLPVVLGDEKALQSLFEDVLTYLAADAAEKVVVEVSAALDSGAWRFRFATKPPVETSGDPLVALARARHIAERHGGSVETETSGGASLVLLRMPVVPWLTARQRPGAREKTSRPLRRKRPATDQPNATQ